MPKYVASTTLDNPTRTNSHVLSGDVATDVVNLNQEISNDIVIHGSATLAISLFPHGLNNEIRLLVYPIVVGQGKKRLFGDGLDQTKLALVEAQPFSTGAVLLTYRTADKAGHKPLALSIDNLSRRPAGTSPAPGRSSSGGGRRCRCVCRRGRAAR
jgi:dihydrofolate reductase